MGEASGRVGLVGPRAGAGESHVAWPSPRPRTRMVCSGTGVSPWVTGPRFSESRLDASSPLCPPSPRGTWSWGQGHRGQREPGSEQTIPAH